MKEAVSLLVMFVIVAMLYEYMKPRNENQSKTQQDDDDEEED